MELTMLSEIIGGKRYRTENAQLLASDAYSDGSGTERLGRNTFLFRTANNNYFMQHQTTWERERDCLTPLARDEAFRIFTELPLKVVEFEDGFPGIKIEDA